MRFNKFFIAFVVISFFSGLLSALVVSGDAGASFAKNKSAEMCANLLVAETYVCSGNAVKVVWADAGRGSTFYMPDGRVIDCPTLEPGKASAECVQFSIPNYCTQKVECEKREEAQPTAPQEERANESKPAEEPAEEKPAETAEKETGQKKESMDSGPIVIGYAGASQPQKTAEAGQIDSYLVLIVLAVMLVVLAAIYFIFKKTVRA